MKDQLWQDETVQALKQAYQEQLATLTAERDALREALRALQQLAAARLPSLPKFYTDDEVVYSFEDADITVGDLRRAAALLKGGAG